MSIADKKALVPRRRASDKGGSTKEADAIAQLRAIGRGAGVVELSLDGTILDANENFLRAVGYERDEVIGRHHRMFVEASYADSREYKDFWAELRAGVAQRAEFRRIGKGGKEVYIEASYNPVLDQDERPYKIVKHATDVTAKSLAKQRTDEENRRMLAESLRAKNALDGSTTLVMIADAEFNIVYINAAMLQFVRRHEAGVQAQLPQFRVDELLGGSIDRFHKNPQRIRQMLASMKGSFRVRIPLGGLIVDQVVVQARDAAGNIVGYSVEWLDMTTQVAAQKDVERVLTAALSGDLTQRIDAARFDGFMKQISEGMNALLDSVSDSFRQVKSAVSQIGQASNELRSTSQMMSSSSVQLNRAAGESSESLTKAADMIKANAENAAMANQLVTQTSAAAEDGQARMEEMTGAMGAINSSAEQIAKIIKVIDEIAFQTNLLALNAAVEAARAGRHGKGFAVVAQEVRNLAERSAKAAKETAALIEDSVNKVSQGVRFADSTRGALRDIIGNVAKVVDLAGEIATASGEQARTIQSVTDSMSQVTESAQAGSQQSNEVASAAEEMGRQMEILRQRVDSYTLPAAQEAKGGGLPAGLSPEIVAQLMALLQKGPITAPATGAYATNAYTGGSNGHANGANGHAAYANGSNGHANGSNGADPRSVLPLDRDERGFRGF
jgi:methyl-accepting chemotaxis protein